MVRAALVRWDWPHQDEGAAMPMLHDPDYRLDIQKRVRTLRADSERKWGKMTVDQMLWHVNETLEAALGKTSPPRERVPLPRPIMKFIVINLPWTKGAPTLSTWKARAQHDFEAERGRCLRLIDELAARSVDSEWPESPLLGRMNGRDVTRLHAKHLNHHLTQFGV